LKKTPTYLHALGFLGAGAGVAAMLWVVGWLVRPDLSGQHKTYTPEELRAAERARDVRFDSNNLPVLHCDVDYGEGKAGRWYPKGESPILAELVKEGKLPPVEARVGPEPTVMTGRDGIGTYGGTWLRVATTPSDVSIISWRMAFPALVRWSPFAYPIKPHVAKHVAASPDKREWTVTLRKGIRWSDGHPFTADDIMYWWDHEVNDKAVVGVIPDWMKSAGQPGTIERLGALRVRFKFAAPYGLFLEVLARHSNGVTSVPAHYLRQYHPVLGDDAVIAKAMKDYKLPSRRALYTYMKDWQNPEHPRMWPWIYRTYKPNPPQGFVRNPYYFVVDPEGNQLPYVDRVQFDVQAGQMLGLSAANGKITMQTRHIKYAEYTELMSRRDRSGTRILHWYPVI